jgi:hypothetical protein
MLNSTRVLTFVKDYFGFPYAQVELKDEEILQYIKDYTLKEFSHYMPQKRKIVLNLSLASNKVTNIENEWYLTEPDNLEILNVIDVIYSQGNLYFFGHPPFGAFSQPTDLRQWALDVHNSTMVKHFSSYDYTFEFEHPNILRITPTPGEDYCTVLYEREQPPDFSGIPNDIQVYFLKFAAYDIGLYIGKIRTKYENVRTPFGEIPLTKEIYEESKEGKRDLIEKLTVGSLPNVTISIG